MPTPFTGTKTIGRLLVNEIRQRMQKVLSIDLGYVDAVNVNGAGESIDYSVRVIVPDKALALNNIPVMSNYMDDGAGHMALPKKGQLCIVGFLNQQAEDAVVLGFIRRTYDANNEQTGFAAAKEAMMSSLKETDYVMSVKDRDLTIKSSTGAKIKLYATGALKVFNQSGYGFEVDASGNVTIRGSTVTFTQTAGTI
jgi:hypothetical protein